MFKQYHNEVRIELDIVPNGPILIKAGDSLAARTNMAFVRTFRNGREEVYLPGSSLKGVIRSHGERIGRTLDAKKICNPFSGPSKETLKHKNTSLLGMVSCGNWLSEEEQDRKDKGSQLLSDEAYRHSCPACRLFGSLAFTGRFNIGDAYIFGNEQPTIEYRDGVGIDRFSGGSAKSAKYDFEVAAGGRYRTEISVCNFEIWQLGWLALVLQDMKEGLVPIGMGTSRGLGKVAVEIQSVEIDVLGPKTPDRIASIADLYEGDGNYGFIDEKPEELADGVHFKPSVLRQRLRLEGQQIIDLFESLMPRFAVALAEFTSLESRNQESRSQNRGGHHG